MAMIDSLGGVTSFQAEGVKMPVQSAAAGGNRIMDETAMESAPRIDANTPAVEKTKEKNDSDFLNNQDNQQRTNEQIRKAVDEMNKKIISNSEVQFGIHEGTNRVTIKIIDRDTKKVIKELPPEKTLDMIAKAWEMAGILVDEKR